MMRKMALSHSIAVLAFLSLAAADGARGLAGASDRRDPKVEFARDIEPLLERSCRRCHSGDKAKSDLRLDVREAALQGGASGKVIVPGKSAESPLYRAVAGLDPDLVMPPPPKPRLSNAEVEILRAWIDQGAEWPESAAGKLERSSTHWAYKKPERPELPPVRAAEWPRNPLDRFVLARLEAEAIAPSPEADPARLLRRASLDLVGLPPSLEELDAFLADPRPDAYERAIDRLLASPRYGERWAALWLDLARYADTQGYEKDNRRTIWRYRDWVIDALNLDMPFDQFTAEQLAGDLLPEPTTDQLIATAFHRNTMTNTEGGTDDEEFRVAAVVDRVNTTWQVWMGTTFGCAQCHNHKYDPFTQREYYEVLAFFNNTADNDQPDETPVVRTPTREAEREIAEARARIERLSDALAALAPQIGARQAEWERALAEAEASWLVLAPSGLAAQNGTSLTALPDGSILAGGTSPETDTYTVEVETDLAGIAAFRLEALLDERLPHKGPGRHPVNGNFVVNELRVEVAVAAGSAAAEGRVPLELHGATASFEQDAAGGLGAAGAVDGATKTGWAVAPRTGQAHAAVFRTHGKLELGGRARLVFTVVQSHGGEHTLGRFRLSATASDGPIDALPLEVSAALSVPPSERSAEQRETIARHYRRLDPAGRDIALELAALEKRLAELEGAAPTTPVLRELPPESSRKTHVLIRGSFLQKGDEVERRTPAVLHPFPEGAPRDRLGLARWLVCAENPLVARVLVNRLWEQYFGAGLVETSEDFGTQGTPPSHPELLDWLATELAREGWRLKPIHRLIVTSATYRQSSRQRPELRERDPYNRLLARGPRVRLSAETLRDQALAASGLLSAKMYGPSVMPPQPDGVWQVVYSGDQWARSPGDDSYRRALYTFWRRTSPYPAMVTFDAPSREFCVLRRVRTNTPLQALVTLNDPVYVEAAQALARRIVRETATEPAVRARHGLRLVLARAPEAAEVERLLGFYFEALARFRSDPQAAEAMATKGAGARVGPAPDGVETAELAAWTAVANVLLNLDEVLTKG